MELYQVTYGNVCAGFIVDEHGVVIGAANILRRELLRRHLVAVQSMAAKRRWRMQLVETW